MKAYIKEQRKIQSQKIRNLKRQRNELSTRLNKIHEDPDFKKKGVWTHPDYYPTKEALQRALDSLWMEKREFHELSVYYAKIRNKESHEGIPLVDHWFLTSPSFPRRLLQWKTNMLKAQFPEVFEELERELAEVKKQRDQKNQSAKEKITNFLKEIL